MFTPAFIAEYNDTVTQLQIAAMRVLKRLLDTETEPKALRQLTAIAFRARKLVDPQTSLRTRQPRNLSRACQEAEQDAVQPSLPTGPAEARSTPAVAPFQDALTPRIPPLRSPNPKTARSPLHLLQAAVSSSPLHTFLPAG